MAKQSVQDWDVDADQNEDVGGVDVRQTAPGANIGPGIREVMAQIKEFIIAATFPGVVTATSFYVSSNAPAIRLIETGAGTNEKVFRVISSGSDTFFQSLTDAGGAGANALVFRRGTGTAWESLDVAAPLLQVSTGLGAGIRFLGDGDTGIGQLEDNTVSIFALNGSTPRLTVRNTHTTAYGNMLTTGAFRAPAGTEEEPSFSSTTDTNTGAYFPADNEVGWSTRAEHRGKFDEDGRFLIGPASYTGLVISDVGVSIQGADAAAPGAISTTVAATAALFINRQNDDGNLVQFYQGGNFEGAISVAGTTITYGSFSGNHWSQLADGSNPEILRGTVIETIDAMCVWPEGNEQLAKFKVSDTAASNAVYGVFMNWDEDGDARIVSLGAYLIRMASGQTVARGDLIESDGTGCGRVQADGIVRSSTIAKVTSPTVVETYGDGSFLCPCTLHCG